MSAEFKFIPQPFDGSQPEISLVEKRNAAKQFTAGIDNLFSKHFEDMLIEPIDQDNFLQKLDLTVPTDTTTYNISVSRNYKKDTDNFLYYGMTVREEDLKKPSHNYTVDASNNVKRFDTTPMQEIPLNDSESEEVDLLPNQEVHPEHFKFITKQILESFKLEETLGLNNQPIGLEEVEKILVLAEQGKSTAVTIDDLITDHAVRVDLPAELDEAAQGITEFEQTVDAYFRDNTDKVLIEPNSELGEIKSIAITDPNDAYLIELTKRTSQFADTSRKVSILFHDVDGPLLLDYIQADGKLYSIMKKGYDEDRVETEATIDLQTTNYLKKFLKDPTF